MLRDGESDPFAVSSRARDGRVRVTVRVTVMVRVRVRIGVRVRVRVRVRVGVRVRVNLICRRMHPAVRGSWDLGFEWSWDLGFDPDSVVR